MNTVSYRPMLIIYAYSECFFIIFIVYRNKTCPQDRDSFLSYMHTDMHTDTYQYKSAQLSCEGK